MGTELASMSRVGNQTRGRPLTSHCLEEGLTDTAYCYTVGHHGQEKRPTKIAELIYDEHQINQCSPFQGCWQKNIGKADEARFSLKS